MGKALACYQPSQRYFLLDEGRWGEDDLPRRNLVSALVGLENSGSAESLSKLLAALSGWLRSPEDDELRRAFAEWIRRVVLPDRFAGAALPVVQALEGGEAMLAESVKEWTEQWFREGQEKGIEQGIEQGLERGREQGREQGLERGREQGLERGLERGVAPKNGRCCVVWRRGSSTPKRPNGFRGCWNASRTRSASPRSATGSSSAARVRTC